MKEETAIVNYYLRDPDKFKVLDLLAGINLTCQELEIIKLCELDGMSEKEAGEKINMSTSAITRGKRSAKHKIFKYLSKKQ